MKDHIIEEEKLPHDYRHRGHKIIHCKIFIISPTFVGILLCTT